MNKEGYTPEQLESLTKERPKNETNKRFVLSKETFAQERMQAVREAVDEIKEKHDEVLSFCMFGSMTKGTAHVGSDIDGYLFIDSERIAQKDGVPEDQVLRAIEGQSPNMTYLTEEVAKKYILEFRDSIKNKSDLKDKDVGHVRTRPISEKVIDKEISSFLTYFKDLDVYKEASTLWFKNYPTRGTSSVDELIAREKAKPHFPEKVSSSLSLMFHLDIGGGIKKYRKLFIKKLQELGPEGERIWTDTITSTEMMENNLSTDKTKRYPRTLAEAVEVYG